MSETLYIPETQDKRAIYNAIIPQIIALMDDKVSRTANLGNFCAALKQTFDFLWVGFYIVEGNQLELGPFQGPIACTTIQKGKGVCGASWERLETIVVPDVEEFPGHIACSSLSKSEIVLPVFNRKNECIGVLDIDSDALNTFDAIDQAALEQLLREVNFVF